jgi:hypothetical protein
MKRNAMILGAALLAATASANAQGYFDFGSIPGVKSEPTVQIDLNSAMLAFINAAAKGAGTVSDEAAVAAAALDGVTNVRVRVYENIEADAGALQKFVEDSSGALERDGWNRVVRINEDGERVHVYMKVATDPAAPAGSLAGITVMVTDEGPGSEAVFINIAGTIQPEQLGRIAGAIGMDGVVLNSLPGVSEQGARQ